MLIQKDVKPCKEKNTMNQGLRALLIQKDVKQSYAFPDSPQRLRALLIQKDVKLPLNMILLPFV